MRISIPLAAAVAAIVVLASVSPSAEAQSMSGPMMGPMMYYSPSKAAKAPPRRPAARGSLARAAGRKGPGSCGTYMYWKGGKCLDARLPKK
jgi:hypothetical protein